MCFAADARAREARRDLCVAQIRTPSRSAEEAATKQQDVCYREQQVVGERGYLAASVRAATRAWKMVRVCTNARRHQDLQTSTSAVQGLSTARSSTRAVEHCRNAHARRLARPSWEQLGPYFFGHGRQVEQCVQEQVARAAKVEKGDYVVMRKYRRV